MVALGDWMSKIGTDVIGKLKPGFRAYPIKGKRLPKIEVRGNSVRVRLKSPSRYSKFRTHDVGRPGYTQRIAGYNPKTKSWETQAWRFELEDLKENPETQELFFDVVGIGHYERELAKKHFPYFVSV